MVRKLSCFNQWKHYLTALSYFRSYSLFHSIQFVVNYQPVYACIEKDYSAIDSSMWRIKKVVLTSDDRLRQKLSVFNKWSFLFYLTSLCELWMKSNLGGGHVLHKYASRILIKPKVLPTDFYLQFDFFKNVSFKTHISLKGTLFKRSEIFASFHVLSFFVFVTLMRLND